jgi:acyl-CoA synthetase (AMP-forming)/AMP-acid ligase II
MLSGTQVCTSRSVVDDLFRINLACSTDCRLLFLTPRIGRHSLEEVLAKLGPRPKEQGTSSALEEIIILRGEYNGFSTYEHVIQCGVPLPSHALQDREAELHSTDVCNLQFTSGSTGNPKAAMLTHQYVPRTIAMKAANSSQQSSKQLPLHRRPDEPHLVRHTMLPTATLPLFRPRARHARCCHPRVKDHLPQ